MVFIEKKIEKEYFEMILSGKKDFEIRLNDFEISEGDIIKLKEYIPEEKRLTGRCLLKIVKCVIKTKNLSFWTDKEIKKFGFQIIGLKNV